MPHHASDGREARTGSALRAAAPGAGLPTQQWGAWHGGKQVRDAWVTSERRSSAETTVRRTCNDEDAAVAGGGAVIRHEGKASEAAEVVWLWKMEVRRQTREVHRSEPLENRQFDVRRRGTTWRGGEERAGECVLGCRERRWDVQRCSSAAAMTDEGRRRVVRLSGKAWTTRKPLRAICSAAAAVHRCSHPTHHHCHTHSPPLRAWSAAYAASPSAALQRGLHCACRRVGERCSSCCAVERCRPSSRQARHVLHSGLR